MYADVHVEINPRNGAEQTSQSTESAPQSAAQSSTAETMSVNSENVAGAPINNGKCENFLIHIPVCGGIDSTMNFFSKS